MMDPGQLRDRVTIQRDSGTSGDGGAYEPTWIEVAQVWANVRPLTVRESLVAQQTASRVNYVVTIRYRQDVSAEMRLVWRGASMNILGVTNPDQHRAFLEITAVLGAPT